MIRQLAIYQFVFLFCPGYIYSFVIFGSDFKGLTGWLYLAGLMLIFGLHFFQRYWLPLLSQLLIRIIFTLAVVVGLFAYRHIHFQAWDEHSLTQAIVVSLFAVLAYLSSVAATVADTGDAVTATGDNFTSSADRMQLAKLLFIFALLWLPGLAYPHGILFAAVLILGLALIWLSWTNIVLVHDKVKYNVLGSSRWRYYVFILSLNFSFIIWDFKVNSSWAAYIALSLSASAIGAILAGFISNQARIWVLGMLVINFIASVLFGDFLLSGVHSVVLGVGLGLGLAWQLQAQQKRERDQFISRIWPYVLLGFIVSYALYAHLSFSIWSLVLIIPIIYFIVSDSRKLTN